MNTQMQYRPFQVDGLLANRHVQSLLASSKLRKRGIIKRALDMLACQQEVLLDGGGSIRLHAWVSEHKRDLNGDDVNRPVVILIHGWEGSGESIYLMSAAAALFNGGFDVVRLHLRDHGPSHHLNRDIFHAARIDEVVNACASINALFPDRQTFLAGFSLGGNFALRVAANATKAGVKLDHVVAISPVVNPQHTMMALSEGWPLYRHYFIKKWQRSLRKKEEAFPDLLDTRELTREASLQSLTDNLVERYTEFSSCEQYFSRYTLTADWLDQIAVPTDIIAAIDDPVIPSRDVLAIKNTTHVRCRLFDHGGHCGFIRNWRMRSWIDEELLRLFKGAEKIRCKFV